MSLPERIKIKSPDRFSLLGIVRGLMMAENLGDVHDELFNICDLIGIPRFVGGYEYGWTDQDLESVGLPGASRPEIGITSDETLP